MYGPYGTGPAVYTETRNAADVEPSSDGRHYDVRLDWYPEPEPDFSYLPEGEEKPEAYMLRVRAFAAGVELGEATVWNVHVYDVRDLRGYESAEDMVRDALRDADTSMHHLLRALGEG